MHPLSRAIKTLTVAVWCLCGLVAVQLVLYGVSYFQSSRWLRKSSVEPSAMTTRPGGSSVRTESLGAQFHDLPPEQKVAKASAILLISYQKDGPRVKAVVAEVLKQEPETVLTYSVGDELAFLSYYPKDDETRGEGQVVFMVGSPAEMRSSFSFNGGRIGGMGDMPLEVLREMVKAMGR